MRKTIFTCDHCGKEIDDMKDYTDMCIDNFFDVAYTDLCSNCFHELNDLVLKYINKKKDE